MRLSIIAAALALAGCMPTVEELGKDMWVPVHTESVQMYRSQLNTAVGGPVRVTEAYAFGRAGTLLCGSRAGEPVRAYVDERGRVVPNPELVSSPC